MCNARRAIAGQANVARGGHRGLSGPDEGGGKADASLGPSRVAEGLAPAALSNALSDYLDM